MCDARSVAGIGLAVSVFAGCAAPHPERPSGVVRYAGSSTVAQFIMEAQPIYGALAFEVDTRPESGGAAAALLDGSADLAGMASPPDPEVLRSGVSAMLVGRDAIAVIVNVANPLPDVSLAALRRAFTGEARNWEQLGGPDLPIRPFIVGPESATRRVFRDAVLAGAEYGGCEEVRPDAGIVDAVARFPGAIGQISFSFLEGATGVRPIAVGGEPPSVTNFDYPISRPLYLLWKPGRPAVDAFAAWTQTEDGQNVVRRRFVGTRVLGSVRGAAATPDTGTLIVYTETYPVYDGGIYYFPHRAYEVLTRTGELVRRIPNHRGENDETAMRIDLPAGTYLIRAETAGGDRPEYLVTIDRGMLTELDVVALSIPQ